MQPVRGKPAYAPRLTANSPVLTEGRFQALLRDPDGRYPHQRIELHYPVGEGLRTAIERICDEAVAAVRGGAALLVLSDRAIAPDTLPIHALLAIGAVHHRLVRDGLRCDANLIVETATARDPHHFAVLLGYGATLVHPWLAYDVLRDLVRSGEIANGQVAKASGKLPQGHQQGPVQDHLQDGDCHRQQLSRRAVVRNRRPA